MTGWSGCDDCVTEGSSSLSEIYLVERWARGTLLI
jgi:hypothetical protein